MLPRFIKLAPMCVLLATTVFAVANAQPLTAAPKTLSAPIDAFTKPKSERKQTWNLKNADIRAIIQAVSVLTKKSFLIDPQVKGNVTFVSQEPMTTAEIYQAFLSMLQVLGYAAVPTGNHAIKIIPAIQAKGSAGMLATRSHPGVGAEIVVRVIPVKNVSAVQLVSVLRTMMPAWASVNAYTPANSLILVGTASNLSRLVSVVNRMDSKSANITSVVPLKHANAKNLSTVLQSLQSGARASGRVVDITIAADEQSNSILLNGNLSNISRMKYLIRRLDRHASANNTIVIHLNYLDAKKLAPVLMKVATGQAATKGRATASVSGISVQAEEEDNAVILHGPSNVLRNLRSVIRQLDVQPSQVLIEAIIVRVDEQLLSQLGIVWGTTASGGAPTNVTDASTGNTFSTVNNGQPSNGGQLPLGTPDTFGLRVTSGVGFIAGGELSAIIHALRGTTSTDILATPSIVVLDNKKATISDGKNIGLTNRSYSTTAVGTNNEITPFNTLKRTDVTLSLTVTPQISPNKMIRLKIVQSNDSVDPTSQGNIQNAVLDVSKITTSVLVRSGDILVLGGLVNHNRIEGEQKIPILGDIPLIGHLFRYKSHRIEKQNLMVFIKPIILNDRIRANRQTRKRYHFMREEQMAVKAGRPMSRHDFSVLPPYESVRRGDSVFLPEPAITVHHKRLHCHHRRIGCKTVVVRH